MLLFIVYSFVNISLTCCRVFPKKYIHIIESSNMSSESDTDSVSLTSVVTPKKKRATVPIRSRRNTPPRPTPNQTKAERELAKRKNEEREITEENQVVINEGWSNTMRDIGMVSIRDKRSDDGKRTYLATTIIVICHNEDELERTSIRLACTGRGNKLVLTRPSINMLVKYSKDEIIESLEESHGQSFSRDEGINRSFSRVRIEDEDNILLTINGVDQFTNTEWQGGKEKQDPYYLKNRRDVVLLGDRPVAFTLSVEIPHVNGVEDVSDVEGSEGEDMDAVNSKLRDCSIGGGSSRKRSPKRTRGVKIILFDY